MLLGLAASLLTLLIAVAPAGAASVPSTFFVVPDVQGPNDVPGQVDLTVFGRDTSTPGLYNLFWDWDSVNFTGQTGDACALFDYNGNGNIDAAVCSEIQNGSKWTEANPEIVQTVTPPNHGFTGGPPYVFRCTDANPERCSNPSDAQAYTSENVKAGVLSQVAGGMPGASPPGNLVTSGIDPFTSDDFYPVDSTLQINIQQAYLLGLAKNLGSKYPAISNAKPTLVNVCSYPSAGNGGNNNPFDCLANPGGGFLKIVKKATGVDGSSTTFTYTVNPGSITKTITGSGETGGFSVAPIGSNYSVAETQLSSWVLTGASCTKADGTSTGTKSGNSVTGITIESGLMTTCTFNNTENEPKLAITKEASPETYSKVGEVISYKIVATNTGNVTLNNVSVEDNPALEGFKCSPEIPTTLAPGASITCTGTHKITQADLDARKIADTACVSATGATTVCGSAEEKAKEEPKLGITKSATPTTYSKVGEVIKYTIVATNTGNVTLSNVSVEDTPELEGFSCSPAIPATLAPGASITCTGTHKITQADLDARKIADTACVAATGATTVCASTEQKAKAEPKLGITKEASPETYSHVGEVISYKIVATNTGNVTLSNVSVEDNPALEGFKCAPEIPTTLAPGASITCTGTHKITQADIDARKIADTACVSATGATTACGSSEQKAKEEPKLGITKEASPETYSKVGQVISYKIVATNTGNVTLNNVFVEDNPALEGFKCSPEIPTTLAPGLSITCTGTHKITQADLDARKIADTACASATGATTVCASTEQKANAEPKLGITKEASPETYSKVGEVISYKIVATNNGNVTLSTVSVEDNPALEGFKCSPEVPTTLAPGASITCTGTHKITQADLDARKIADTACVTASGAEKACASTEQKAKAEPKLAITKEASPETYSKAGEVISYKIVATNTGNVTLSNVSVEDNPALEGFKCSPEIPATLAPGASVTCTGTHTVTQADLEAGKVADTACVTAPGAEKACASVELIGPPSLAIAKTADVSGTPSTVAAAGNPIGFTVMVTSNGASAAKNVSLSDPLPSGSGISWSIASQTANVTCSISGSAPNQTLTCTKAVQPVNESFSVRVTSATTTASAGTYNNTATASATKVAPVQATAHITVYAQCTLGYPTGSAPARSSVGFSESEVLRAFAAVRPDGTIGGSIAGPNDRIALWYNDEHALTLGVRQVSVKTSSGTTPTPYQVTADPASPSSASNPQVGTTQQGNNLFFPNSAGHNPQGFPNDQAGTDTATWSSTYFFLDSGRPMWPALFTTDITNNPANKSGDWQQGGTAATPPNDIFGTWKGAVRTVDKTKSPYGITVTPDADPATKNNWSLGPGSDTPPGGFAALKNEGYGGETRWNVSSLGLEPGHAYRLEFMVHDGDQNKAGGDAGEACMNVVIPG